MVHPANPDAIQRRKHQTKRSYDDFHETLVPPSTPMIPATPDISTGQLMETIIRRAVAGIIGIAIVAWAIWQLVH